MSTDNGKLIWAVMSDDALIDEAECMWAAIEYGRAPKAASHLRELIAAVQAEQRESDAALMEAFGHLGLNGYGNARLIRESGDAQ